MYQLFNFILITWRDLFPGKAKEVKEVNWSSLSSSNTVTFQYPITLATEVIERTRNPLSRYILNVISRFNQEKECAEIIEISDDTSKGILLAEVKIVGSDGFPTLIQITNYNLSDYELRLFSGMRLATKPNQYLPLRVISPEELLY